MKYKSMRKTKREKDAIKATGHAQMLSQEILAGLRRNSTDQVCIDEDSMENIDEYWNMANKELEEMQRKQYEDISILETIDEMTANKKEISPISCRKSHKPIEAHPGTNTANSEGAVSEAHSIIRRSFDEEFQANLQNAILTGFSDSEEAESDHKDNLPVKEETEDYTQEDSKISVDKKRPGKSKKDQKTKNTLLYIESIKDKENNKGISKKGMRIEKVEIKPKKTIKVERNCFYYIIRGALVIENASISKEEKVAVVHRKRQIEGRQLKSGSVFTNGKAAVVYNSGVSPCTLLVFAQERSKKTRKQKEENAH